MDEKNQILITSIWLDQEWIDELLVWDPEDFNGLKAFRIPCGRIWTPDIVLYNNADDFSRGFYQSRAMVHDNGYVFWPTPTQLRSTCKIDVTYFPFDSQHCYMKLGSWTYTGFEVDVTNRSLNADLSSYIENGEFELVGVYQLRRNIIYSCCPEPYPDVVYFFHIRRKILYYMLNVVLPCTMMSLLTLLVYCLPPDSGEKIGLGITVLLAFSVFGLQVAEKVPETSDSVPLIGIYLTIVMDMTGLSVVMTVLVLSYHHQGPFRAQLPNWVRVIFLGYVRRLMGMKFPDESLPMSPDSSNNKNKPIGEEDDNVEKMFHTLVAAPASANTRRISAPSSPSSQFGGGVGVGGAGSSSTMDEFQILSPTTATKKMVTTTYVPPPLMSSESYNTTANNNGILPTSCRRKQQRHQAFIIQNSQIVIPNNNENLPKSPTSLPPNISTTIPPLHTAAAASPRGKRHSLFVPTSFSGQTGISHESYVPPTNNNNNNGRMRPISSSIASKMRAKMRGDNYGPPESCFVGSDMGVFGGGGGGGPSKTTRKKLVQDTIKEKANITEAFFRNSILGAKIVMQTSVDERESAESPPPLRLRSVSKLKAACGGGLDPVDNNDDTTAAHGGNQSGTDNNNDGRTTKSRSTKVKRKKKCNKRRLEDETEPAPPHGRTIRNRNELEGEVLKTLQMLISRQQLDDECEEMCSEWRQLAAIIDRLLFWVFFTGNLMATFILLLIVPTMNQDSDKFDITKYDLP